MNSRWTERRLDRRALLRGGLLGGAGLAAAALIGCGGSGDDESEAQTLEELRRARESGASSGASAEHAAASSTDTQGAAQDEHAAASSTDAQTDAHGEAQDEHAAAAAEGDAPHWTYAGAGGPDEWGQLDPEFSACSAGRNQSPINIAATTGVGADDVAFNYQRSSLTVINNGHTIQANVPPGNTVTVDGKAFGLLQFHFHSPSEHAVDGGHFPLEMHLVHRNTEGSLAVVGVFFEDGAGNAPLEPVWAVMPHTTEDQGVVTDFDLEALLPASRGMFRYSGSLTTPPCSEGVRWMLMQTPVQASQAQVEAFAGLVGPNNRPLQSTGAREILQESSPHIATNR